MKMTSITTTLTSINETTSTIISKAASTTAAKKYNKYYCTVTNCMNTATSTTTAQFQLLIPQ